MSSMVMLASGELGVVIDYGFAMAGDVVQRRVNNEWINFEIEGTVLTYPFTIEELPPGRYRVVHDKRSANRNSK